jgi:hypothetical protein
MSTLEKQNLLLAPAINEIVAVEKDTAGDGDCPHQTLEEKAAANADTGKPAWRLAILTMFPFFMGYAGMIILQELIKHRLNIPKGNNARADVFGTGVSFLYLGNLIFRVMHNVFLTCLKPRQRVLLAYVLMACAHTLLAIMYYPVHSQSVVWVYVAYLIAGVAVGCFESNLVSCLTPLGHATKMWAIFGIPTGFNFISIGSFLAFAVDPHSTNLQFAIYLLIAVSNLLGLLFMHFVVPDIEFEASHDTVMVFFRDLKKWREWAPFIWRHCLSLCADMFAVSLFTSLGLYLYNQEDVPLWPYSETTMPKNAFLAWFYFFTFLGDFISRRVAYHDKARSPFLYLVSTSIGALLILTKTAICGPIGVFMVMFANGSIYCQTTKFVDNVVPKKYNLVGLSVWLFVGDVGSFVGAQMVQPIQGWLGPVPSYNSTQGYF